jgi:hypothetical protein
MPQVSGGLVVPGERIELPTNGLQNRPERCAQQNRAEQDQQFPLVNGRKRS